MVNFKKVNNIILGLAVSFFFCSLVHAQQQTEKQSATREPSRNTYGIEQSPDFAQENLSRVAASAVQIRMVLVKDEGLLVELKRWVAKEATDNGQVVEDSTLTDQAIFERLDKDVTFRSIATRLLQRYGYLIPTPNPDSEYAKENEFVLKERARRLVQIEAQEDSEALQPQKNDRDLERTATCDPRRDRDCPQQSPMDRRQNTGTPGGMYSPETNPQTVPEQPPAESPSRLLRADGLPQTPDPLEGGTDVNATTLSARLDVSSNPVKPDSRPLEGSQATGQGTNGNSRSGR